MYLLSLINFETRGQNGAFSLINFDILHRQSLIEGYVDDVPGQQRQWLYNHFQMSVVIDLLLIQRWILSILDKQFRDLPNNLGKLNMLKRDLVLALEEYHGVTLSYGSAQNIVRQAREIMGITEMRQGVMQKLDNLERLIETDMARRSAYRELLVNIGAVVAALLFGLPGAWQTVQVIGDWNTSSPTLWWRLDRAVLNFLIQLVQTRPVLAAILFYFIAVGIITIIVILSLWPPQGRRQRILNADQSEPAKRPGFTWHTSVEIVSKEETNGRTRT